MKNLQRSLVVQKYVLVYAVLRDIMKTGDLLVKESPKKSEGAKIKYVLPARSSSDLQSTIDSNTEASKAIKGNDTTVKNQTL